MVTIQVIQIKKLSKNIFLINQLFLYKNGKSIFYETGDPDCSSLLEPNEIYFKNWYFSHRFNVKKKKISQNNIN